jgi:hypothetical protein
MGTTAAETDTASAAAEMKTAPSATAEMGSASPTTAEMRSTPSASPTAVSAPTTPTVSASPAPAMPGHRIDRGCKGHDGCQQHGNKSNSTICHDRLPGAKAASTGEPAEAPHYATTDYFCC